MSVNKYIPKLYSGFFDPLLKKESKDSFHKQYKHLKKRCHCQTLKQIISISNEHLKKEDDVEDLKKVLEGLRVVREKYPRSSRWKRIFRVYNTQFRNSQDENLKELNSTIFEYVQKIEKLSGEEIKEDHSLLRCLDDRLVAFNYKNSAYDNVKKLLYDPNFLSLADETVKSMVAVSNLPTEEVIRNWGEEMGNLVEKCPKESNPADIYLAMLFANIENTSKLITRMQKLKNQDPSIMSPLNSKFDPKKTSVIFWDLATSINVALGEEKAKEMDLLGARYREALHDVFETKKIPNAVEEVLDKYPDLQPDIRNLIVQMKADLEESSPETALENFKEGVCSLFEKKSQKKYFNDLGEFNFFVEALVVLMAQDRLENTFVSFTLVFEACLNQMGHLDGETQYIVNCFVDTFKNYTHLDLTGEEPKQVVEASVERESDEYSVRPDIKGWDVVTKQMDLGHKNAIQDLKLRDEYDSFKEETDRISKSWQFRWVMKSYSNLKIDEVFHVLGGRSLDQIDLKHTQLLMYVIYEKNPEVFSSIVHRLMMMDTAKKEEMGANYVKFCHAVDFVVGIDPRNVKVEDDRLIFEQLVRIEIDAEQLERNIRLTKEQFQWLAELDQERPPEGVAKASIHDAKNIVGMLENESFKKDVEEMLSSFCNLGLPFGTEAKRRFFNSRQKEITGKFARSFDPSKNTFSADDYIPFMQAMISVSPELGRDFLVHMAQEDASILESVKSNDDWLFYTMYNLVEYYFDQEKCLILPYMKVLASSKKETVDAVEIDLQDLGPEGDRAME